MTLLTYRFETRTRQSLRKQVTNECVDPAGCGLRARREFERGHLIVDPTAFFHSGALTKHSGLGHLADDHTIKIPNKG